MAASRSLLPPTSAPLPRWHLPPALTIAAAALVLTARIVPVPALESALCALDPIRANAAAGFLLAGVSLALSGRAASRGSSSTAGRLLGAAVALAGAVEIAEYLAGTHSGLDGLLYIRPLACDADVRMPPVTALAFTVLGVALALQGARPLQRVANALVGSVSLLTAVAGLGLLYGASTVYATGRFNAMTPGAAALFALLCAGFFVSYPGLHRSAPLYAASRESSALRRLLVATLPLPPLAGAALVYGVRADLYDVAFGTAVLVASGLAVFTLLFLRNASVLDTFRRAREEAEARFRNLVEFLPDGVLVVGGDGLIRMANRRAEQLFGRSRAQLVGQPIESLIPERFRTAHLQHVATYLETPEPAPRAMSDALGLTALRADGTEFPVDVSLGPLHREGESTAVAIVRDATERRAAERALRESEQRYRDVIQNIDEVVYVVDVTDDPSAGRVVFLSDRVRGATGYAPPEFLDNPQLWMSAIHPDDQASVASDTRRMLADHVPILRVYRMRHKQSGDWRWIEDRVVPQPASDGARVRLFGVARDVTAARLAGEALKQSEARYREIFENEFTGVYVAAPQGALLACNPAFVAMFGFASTGEALAADFRSLFRSASDRSAFLDALATRRRVENHEVEFQRADGKALHAVQNAVGVLGPGGDLVEIRGYVTDTTAHRQLEDQLRQAQKMEAVGRLAGGLAHDMNNMLTAILGFSELWLGSAGPDAPGRADVEEIQDAGRRASDLTRGLLAFSRRQIVRPVVVDVNATVSGLEKLIRRLIGEDLVFVTNLTADRMHVRIDPGQIEQMLANLVVNARDAMPGGGTLTIETATAGEHETEGPPDARPGPLARISVSDTGTGIDAETLPHIFEPFFTTKEAGKGTGLGLSTIYGIVQQAGGVIEVRSEPGATTFDIYLPLTDAPLTPAEASFSDAGRQIRHLTVLMVEDDDAVRRFVRKTLEAEGYRVLEAANGSDALGLLDRHQDSVDLVLTDVVMPGMSGRALADQVRRRLPGVKVLYMSGYPSTVIAGQGVLDPGIHFLEKPFSGGVLKGKVVEMFAGDAADSTVH